MPRHMETMKDVISCDKPRVGANNLKSLMVELTGIEPATS